jgi:hypothetical protein
MPLSGLIGAGAQDAFQQLVQQRLIEEERRQARAQQEWENAQRQRQLEEAAAERAESRAYRERGEKRDIEREKQERLGRTIENLMRAHDPTTGAPLVVPPEVAAATAGTEFAPLIEERQIFPEATVGEMGPEPGTPRTEAQLRKTTAMRTAEEAETKKRQAATVLQNLLPTLSPEMQRYAQLAGPEGAMKAPPAAFKTQAEIQAEQEAESQRRIREAMATRAPREPEQPDVYLERKLPSGEVQSTLETNASARRLLQSGQGWTMPGKGTAAGGGRVPAQLMRSVEALGNINTALDRIRETSAAINTEEGVTARATGLMARGKQMAGYNPELVRMDAATKGRLSQFARALGEVGVLSNQDIQRVETLMPTVSDTKSEAQAKIEELQFIFDGATNRVRELAESQGVQLPTFMKGPGQQPAAQMGPPAPAPPAGQAAAPTGPPKKKYRFDKGNWVEVP